MMHQDQSPIQSKHTISILHTTTVLMYALFTIKQKAISANSISCLRIPRYTPEAL